MLKKDVECNKLQQQRMETRHDIVFMHVISKVVCNVYRYRIEHDEKGSNVAD